MSIAEDISTMETNKPGSGGIRSRLAHSLLLPFYRKANSETLRAPLRRLIMRLEGGPLTSLTVREILRRFYELEVGLHSQWPHTHKPQVFQRGTCIGRYAFVADSVRTYTRNHPMETKSTHGLFYHPGLGKAGNSRLEFGRLMIGHGACVEHNAIILPPTERIGEGAYIKAGSVVYTDVPPYAIVSGFPAVVRGYRFEKDVIARLLESQWWERSPEALEADPDYFCRLAGESSAELARGAADSGTDRSHDDNTAGGAERS